ncbi:MAG: hypothetical protein QN174_07725 [Armatimonadota bacterium]|nr:hypothetical protein [Armatimonadota bacterium]
MPPQTTLVTKPGIEETEQEFRVRLRDPADFQPGSFRRIPIKRDKPRVFGIVGRLKGETKTTLQSLRFPKGDGWTADRVRDWLREHDFAPKDYSGETDAPEIEVRAVEDADLIELYLHQLETGRRAERALAERTTAAGLTKMAAVEVKRVDEDEHEADIYISTDQIDRDREQVLPGGLVLPKPRRVPLVSSHVYGDLRKQIGDVPAVEPREKDVRAQARWFAGLGNPEADWAWTLVQLGVAAFSIGFLPLAWEDADLSDEKVAERVRAGREPIRRYTKWELAEVSQVIVPSNRGAVQRMVDAGILTEAHLKALDGRLTDAEMGERERAGFEAALAAYATRVRATAPESEGSPNPAAPPAEGEYDLLRLFAEAAEPLDELDVAAKAGDWRVGGARDLTLIDDDAWDAAAAVRAIRRWAGATSREALQSETVQRRYRQGFVVYDAAAPDRFGSYKLPFAKVQDGRLVASRRGLIAVRVVLAGGRNAPDIGDARAAAVRFVNAYLGEGEERDLATVAVKLDGDEFLKQMQIVGERIAQRLDAEIAKAFRAHITRMEGQIREIAQAAAATAFPADSAAHATVKDLIAAVLDGVTDLVRREIAIARGDPEYYRVR